MIRGFLDIPYDELMRYRDAVVLKKSVCRVMPQGRFNIQDDGTIYFTGLVCRDLGGESTGVGAVSCRNCVLEGGV